MIPNVEFAGMSYELTKNVVEANGDKMTNQEEA
jgi:hypothetical protein